MIRKKRGNLNVNSYGQYIVIDGVLVLGNDRQEIEDLITWLTGVLINAHDDS